MYRPELIEIIFLSAVSAVAWVRILCHSAGILAPLPAYLKPHLYDRIAYPLFDCAKCNSIYWLFAYCLMTGIYPDSFVLFLSMAMPTMVLAALIEKLIA